jgi:hypothetical protein
MDAGRPRFEADRREREELAGRFFDAFREGDVDGLRELLAAEVNGQPGAIFRDRDGKVLNTWRSTYSTGGRQPAGNVGATAVRQPLDADEKVGGRGHRRAGGVQDPPTFCDTNGTYRGDVSAVEEIRAQALEVAGGWSPAGAPESWRLTAGLFQAIAAHDELLGRLAALPPDRLPALLASAAISYLVRRDQPVPLAAYFPEPGAPQPRFDDGFPGAARAFVSARLDDIAAECAGRRYQMSEVARCTQIALGIAAAGVSPTGPVALADLGTGAGLGLNLDRYRYLVDGRASGPRDAAMTLRCEVRGFRPPPHAVLPPIAERVGIDCSPLDPRDLAARSWLEACAPPEASGLDRLAAAIEVARRYPARLVAGDVVAALPAVLDSFPPGRRVIVTDAYLAVFLPPPARAELAAIMAHAGRTRPLTWLSLDPLVPLGPSGRDSVQGIALPSALVRDYQRHGVFAVLGERTFDGDTDRARLLARAHPSGEWIEWLDPC